MKVRNSTLPIFRITVSEPFSKRIAGNLQLSNLSQEIKEETDFWVIVGQWNHADLENGIQDPQSVMLLTCVLYQYLASMTWLWRSHMKMPYGSLHHHLTPEISIYFPAKVFHTTFQPKTFRKQFYTLSPEPFPCKHTIPQSYDQCAHVSPALTNSYFSGSFSHTPTFYLSPPPIWASVA